MIDETHPYEFLKSIFELHPSMEVHFSKYVYKPDSLFDERYIFKIGADKVSNTWLKSVVGNLKSDEELALHSNVLLGGRTLHIPMIDFSRKENLDAVAVERLGYFVAKNIIRQMEYFSSGRSFHGYSTCLVRPKEWRQFNGRLLLVNSSDSPDIIDARWVGHRLIAGYSSLRWSCNTKQYTGYPVRICSNTYGRASGYVGENGKKAMNEELQLEL